MALRRHAAIEVGGFDERLGPGAPLHGEEHDLVLRLYEAGWQGVVADAPVVEHLDWRDDSDRLANLLVYSRGAGAFLGAALPRLPKAAAPLVVSRARSQPALSRPCPRESVAFGPPTFVSFAHGRLRGVL